MGDVDPSKPIYFTLVYVNMENERADAGQDDCRTGYARPASQAQMERGENNVTCFIDDKKDWQPVQHWRLIPAECDDYTPLQAQQYKI